MALVLLYAAYLVGEAITLAALVFDTIHHRRPK